MNKVELEVAMLRRGISVTKLSEITGLSRPTIYRKLESGKFDRAEIIMIRDALELTDADMLRIFFSEDGYGNVTQQEGEKASERTETV